MRICSYLLITGVFFCLVCPLPPKAYASDRTEISTQEKNLNLKKTRLNPNSNLIAALPQGHHTTIARAVQIPSVNLRGWDHLFVLLAQEGMDPAYLVELFTDPRMPKKEPLFFNPKPRESRYLYRKHNTTLTRKNALRFYEKNYQHFRDSNKKFGVPQNIVLAILQVESHCGAHTGRSQTFYRLARLASAASSKNIEKNFDRLRKRNKKLAFSVVEKRAKWLEQTFLPHTVASVAVAREMKIHPLELRGSAAGAIGLPQFLPGNVSRFGIDGNNDNKIDLFAAEDSIYSVANFLLEHGWRGEEKMSSQEERDVLFAYNRSKPYGKTILSLARSLKNGIARIAKKQEAAAANQSETP